MRFVTRVSSVATMACIACAPRAPGETALDLGPAWADLGAGESEYVPLEDGDPVPVVLGPQGGHMVALGIQAGGIAGGDPADPTQPDNPRLTYQGFLEVDGVERVLGSITVALGLEPLADGAMELVGTWLVFDASVDTSLYFDHPVRLSAQVVDHRGVAAGDEVTVLAIAPEAS